MRSPSERNGAQARVLVNSLPKSGTHLLGSILTVMGFRYQKPVLARNIRRHPVNRVWLWDRGSCLLGVGQPQSVKLSAVRYLLRWLGRGRYALGHIPHQECIDALLRELCIRSFFVIRDPRDVVVSQVHYYLDQRSHYLHRAFRALPTDEARLVAAIRGLPACAQQPQVNGIARKLDITLGWMESDSVVTIRFEEMVGEEGGGTGSRQIEAISRIGEQLGIHMTADEALSIGAEAFGEGRTYREGRVEGWRSAFSQRVRDVFRREAGGYLISMGYESSDDW